MHYQYLLIDNDNTLMDFDCAEKAALRDTLTAFVLPHDDAACELYHGINHALWEALERGEITQSALKVERFRQLLAALHRDDLSAETLCDGYENRLATHAELMPGAMHLLETLRPKMKIALVSNGISRIQRGRLACSTITPYLDAVMISEECGVSKPDPHMVFKALEALGCKEYKQAVLLGDSPTADIPAAKSAGIDSVFYAQKGKTCPDATYTVHSLAEAETLLDG